MLYRMQEQHPAGTKLGKAQIIKQSQKFCDEAMAPNFFAGRLFAGWKSIDTLVKHGQYQTAAHTPAPSSNNALSINPLPAVNFLRGL